MKRTIGEKAFNVVNIIFMVVFAFVCLYPFIYVTVLSFNDGQDAARGGIYFWPRALTLENYKTIFSHNDIINAYKVTIFRVVVGTVLTVLLNAAAAYSMSKKYLLGRKIWNWFLIIPMYFGGSIIPYYMVIRSLGLLNSIWVYIIPGIYAPFSIILMRTFIKEIPDSYEESARLDGAGDFTIFSRIILPLSGPILATMALFSGVGNWNDWFAATLFVSSKKLWPVATLLLNILQSSDINNFVNFKFLMTRKVKVTPEAVKMTMLIVTTVPIVMVYPFLQKYFVKGVMIGSLKE